MTPAEMRARVEEMAQRAREEMAGASEVDYLDALLARQHAILTAIADALRGDPGPLASHSHHDLAERAAALVALLAVTRSSLEAASSGRRVTVVDEVERLQRERDALRDAAREYLAARDVVSGLVRERAHERPTAAESWAALDAARTRLAALVGGDATMRRDLPAEAVVSCPACGVDITADLDDDAEYITRRHSRRTTAIGLGEIVWCDGGIARAGGPR